MSKSSDHNYSIVGQSQTMKCGLSCTVVEDNGRNNIIVEFEDGYVAATNRYDFRHGYVNNPNICKGSIVGQTALMHCGMKCTVIEDNGSRDISVKFDDGTIVSHVRRSYFTAGSIANPNLGKMHSKIRSASIKGQTTVMKSGMKCTVIEDLGKEQISVQFEDGTIKNDCSRDSFRKGSIIHPNLGRGFAYSKKNSILGQSKTMKCGMRCTVIEDNNASDISVQFEDGTIVRHRIRHSFQTRCIVNPALINVASMPQGLIYFFVRKFFPDAIQNYRPDWLKNENTGANFEIDIWIPSIRTGVEYDGVAWHHTENERSAKKKQLLEQSVFLDKIINILERGSTLHQSPKHVNIQLGTTSDSKERSEFLVELEQAINSVLSILGISETIVIDDTVLEEIYSSGSLWTRSQNLSPGVNDLQTMFPDLVADWDYDKNTFLPTEITSGSGRKVWWKCAICGYSWSSIIQNRTRGQGCPQCSRRNRIVKNAKQVVNIDTGMTYNSIQEAGEKTGIDRRYISRCCNGTRKTAGGYRWKFFDSTVTP